MNFSMMTPILIGIHAKPRAGKDSVCNYLLKTKSLIRFGPSVQVKKTTAAMFNIPEEYLYDDDMKDTIDPYWGISYREMAQKVGKESSRDIFGEDFWIRHVEKYLHHDLPITKSGIILADIRYKNEVEWVKQKGGKVIFITRKNKPAAANETHPAEIGLPEELADFIIRNDGTLADLYASIDELEI